MYWESITKYEEQISLYRLISLFHNVLPSMADLSSLLILSL